MCMIKFVDMNCLPACPSTCWTGPGWAHGSTHAHHHSNSVAICQIVKFDVFAPHFVPSSPCSLSSDAETDLFDDVPADSRPIFGGDGPMLRES